MLILNLGRQCQSSLNGPFIYRGQIDLIPSNSVTFISYVSRIDMQIVTVTRRNFFLYERFALNVSRGFPLFGSPHRTNITQCPFKPLSSAISRLSV